MIDISLEKRVAARDRPKESPLMHQDWRDLLFMHWPYDPIEIQKTLPPGLFVDTFDGKAYISLIPFFMENVNIFSMPYIPGLSSFIEVNVRTYVYDKSGTPGIWFYSLDINSFLAANAARKGFSLPYFFTELVSKEKKNHIHIEGKRVDEPHAKIMFSYLKSDQSPKTLQPGTLDFFLLERYALFTFAANQLSIGRVHHQPYPICQGNVSDWSSDLLLLQSFDLADQEPQLVHYSPGVSVDIFGLKKVK